MTITFYDIDSTLPNKALSPNTWKTRFCLNYKRIAYKTEWLDAVDIEPKLKKLGVNPTSKKPDGSDFYTLPAIHDPSTGTYLADSFLIAQYLDKTYPDTPPIFPANSTGLQSAFEAQFMSALDSLWKFINIPVISKLTPSGQKYARKIREESFGKTLEELEPKGEDAVREWEKLKAAFGKIDGYYVKTDESGPFLLGQSISWGDIVVASFIIWIRLSFGEDSRQWKDISEWHGGRWGGILKQFDDFSAVL